MKLGIAWYREDQWQLLKSTAFDPDIIEETYEEWIHNAKKSLKKMKNQGVEPIKVDFDVNEFNAWCKDNKKSPNGDSRCEYVALRLQIEDTRN
jgi:hypothetical protein